MKSLYLKGLIVTWLFCLLLAACGGGGTTAGGGIDGTGIMSAGVVSAYGSIVVNGTTFDTSSAEVFINGEKVGEGDDDVRDNLNIGMVVTVEGRIKTDGNAVADRVLYSSNVAGPVESISSIDPTTKEIVVLGQTVFVNVITKYKPDAFGFDSIALDDVVEVSGYIDDNGAIRATLLKKIGDITTILEYEVTGIVENLDNPTPNTFVINDLTIDYSSISVEDLPDNFDNGLFVEVEGVLGAGGELIASKMELGDEFSGDDIDEVEIMGFVTEIILDSDIIEFKIGNQVVQAQADPELVIYMDGSPDDIVPGQKLKAEGSIIGGVLVAHEIEFWKPDQIEFEGVVTNIVSDTVFNFAGLAVQIDPQTIFENGNQDDIMLGVRLEVKGVPLNIDHSIIAADKISFEYD